MRVVTYRIYFSDGSGRLAWLNIGKRENVNIWDRAIQLFRAAGFWLLLSREKHEQGGRQASNIPASERAFVCADRLRTDNAMQGRLERIREGGEASYSSLSLVLVLVLLCLLSDYLLVICICIWYRSLTDGLLYSFVHIILTEAVAVAAWIDWNSSPTGSG